MVNAGKWCVKTSGDDAILPLPNFYVLPTLSSQLSVFSSFCIMNTLLHFLLLLCQSCHCLRSVPFGGRILGLIKLLITVGWAWWRHQRGSIFSLASSPPNLKPTTGCNSGSFHWALSVFIYFRFMLAFRVHFAGDVNQKISFATTALSNTFARSLLGLIHWSRAALCN